MGEFPDWGCSGFGPPQDHQRPGPTYLAQWLEALDRDYSHPSIVGWCPLNETGQRISDHVRTLDDVTRGLFLATKLADRTRPVIDTSGYSHREAEADVYDSHDYEQDPEVFRRNHERLISGDPFVNRQDGYEISIPYMGQPYLVSEFGGTWWGADEEPGESSWGYGERPKSAEEFFRRFRDLCTALLDNPGLAGYCYTQLTDVYQERNGLVNFDRGPKLALERLREVQNRPASIETEAKKPKVLQRSALNTPRASGSPPVAMERARRRPVIGPSVIPHMPWPPATYTPGARVGPQQPSHLLSLDVAQPKCRDLSQLGSQIRARRRGLGLTLVEIAERSGLSQPFLSQVERGSALPSMRSLNSIAVALGTTGPALLALPAEPAVSLVRPGSGVEVKHPGGVARLIAHGERTLLPMEFRGGPREFQEYYQHTGEEFIYVISGTIEFDLEGSEAFRLRSRDCLYYDPTKRHRWRRTGPKQPWVLVVSNQPH